MSNTATIAAEQSFEWLSGTKSISHWKKDSGFTAHFCKTCGSPVPNRLRDSSYYWIPMGLVEEADVNITTHICCSSKASWDVISKGVTHIDDMPADLDVFIQSFQHLEE